MLGNCDISNELKSLLSDIEVDTKYLITQKNRISSKKSRIIVSQQQVVRYDRESSDDINLESQNTIIETFNKIVKDYEVILLSDYDKGVLTNQLTQSLINIANKYNKNHLIAVKKTQECKNGDIVVARINDEVTVKTFRTSGEGDVTLEPENKDFKPIKVNPKKEEFYLEGICVGVIKRF